MKNLFLMLAILLCTSVAYAGTSVGVKKTRTKSIVTKVEKDTATPPAPKSHRKTKTDVKVVTPAVQVEVITNTQRNIQPVRRVMGGMRHVVGSIRGGCRNGSCSR